MSIRKCKEAFLHKYFRQGALDTLSIIYERQYPEQSADNQLNQKEDKLAEQK